MARTLTLEATVTRVTISKIVLRFRAPYSTTIELSLERVVMGSDVEEGDKFTITIAPKEPK